MQSLATVVSLAAGLLALVAAPVLAQAPPSLEAVKKRGELACGVNALWYRGGVMYPLPVQW